MAENSKISWTDATWNPIAGCTPVSPGCTHCYAATMARRLEAMGQSKYAGTAERRGSVDVFTGKINFDEAALSIPLKRKKPTKYFVNSMSDLFHDSVPFEFVDKAFAVMALCQEHTFQVLTKRPERMAEYFNESMPESGRWDQMLGNGSFPWPDAPNKRLDAGYVAISENYELPNVWLGVSCEDKARLPRLDVLRTIPAAVRFVSFEPLLEDLGEIDLSGIHWAISGGESGPHARPHNIRWSWDIGQQCQAAGTSWWHKQHGARPIAGGDFHAKTGPMEAIVLKDRSGSDPTEWGDGWLQQMPGVTK